MVRRRNLFLQVFFALLLAFAQQQAIRHELGHDLDRIHTSSKDAAAHEDAFCAKCVALAHLDHGNHGSAVLLALSGDTLPQVAGIAHQAPAGPSVPAYLSRAPPFSS